MQMHLDVELCCSAARHRDGMRLGQAALRQLPRLMLLHDRDLHMRRRAKRVKLSCWHDVMQSAIATAWLHQAICNRLTCSMYLKQPGHSIEAG